MTGAGGAGVANRYLFRREFPAPPARALHPFAQERKDGPARPEREVKEESVEAEIWRTAQKEEVTA